MVNLVRQTGHAWEPIVPLGDSKSSLTKAKEQSEKEQKAHVEGTEKIWHDPSGPAHRAARRSRTTEASGEKTRVAARRIVLQVVHFLRSTLAISRRSCVSSSAWL